MLQRPRGSILIKMFNECFNDSQRKLARGFDKVVNLEGRWTAMSSGLNLTITHLIDKSVPLQLKISIDLIFYYVALNI